MRSIDPDKRPALARLRARSAAACAAAGSRLRAESGSALIEVMIGAVILSIATVGLLNGIDGAQSTGGTNKARSVAAALAEQDIERMRSMKVTQLAGYTNTRTVTVRGVDYTVVSKASWSVDSGGPVSCSNISRTAANIRIVSEVSSNATKGIVDQVSLVTPPPGTYGTGEGRAIVKLQDRDGDPVAGKQVNLSGTASFSEVTNSLGCAVFPFIPIGNYTAGPQAAGCDWDGNSLPTKSLTVNQSQSTAVSFEVDTCAEIRATFDTAVNGVTAATPAESRWLTVANAKLIVGSELFTAGGTSPATATQINATSLFPFLDGYSVYPGQCTANAAGARTYTPAPGQILTVAAPNKLRLPSINIRVVSTNSTTSPGPSGVNGATVYVRPTGGCANTFPPQNSASVTYGSTTYAGAIPKPGYPYGTYQICAQLNGKRGFADVPPYTSGGPSSSETITSTAAAGNNVTWGSGLIRIYINPSSTSATCSAAGY